MFTYTHTISLVKMNDTADEVKASVGAFLHFPSLKATKEMFVSVKEK